MSDSQIVPERVTRAVEDWATRRHEDAATYDTVEVLDEGGVTGVHALVAAAYAQGWSDGEKHTQIRYERRLDRAENAARRRREVPV